MRTPEPDLTRRRMRTGTVSVIGAVGVGLTAVPFIESLEPSERARALGAPVSVELSKLGLGLAYL